MGFGKGNIPGDDGLREHSRATLLCPSSRPAALPALLVSVYRIIPQTNELFHLWLRVLQLSQSKGIAVGLSYAPSIALTLIDPIANHR